MRNVLGKDLKVMAGQRGTPRLTLLTIEVSLKGGGY